MYSSRQVPLKSAIAKEDEAAAMAAMFQAQTANWEETQEKMSQLVSLSSGFSMFCSSVALMDVAFFYFYTPRCHVPARIVLHVSILILEGPLLVVEASHSLRNIITSNRIGRCLPAMSVTAVARKVGSSSR